MLDLRQLHNHIHALESGDENSQREAMHSLGHHEEREWVTAPPKVVDSLVETLQQQLLKSTKRPFIRQEAATILGKMGARSELAIPQLMELLQDGIPDSIREAAATALGKIGKGARVAVSKLIDVLANCRPSLAVQIVRALGDIGTADQKVKTALINTWQLPVQSSKVHVQIAIALCKLKIEATGLVRFLTGALVSNQDAALRKSAAEALAFCNKNEVDVVPALLISALHDKDDDVRLVAEAGLSQLRLSHDKAIQLCTKQLKESAYAETALRNSGQAAVPALIEALKTTDPATREKAIRTLGSIGELAAAAAPDLTKALQDKNLDVRLAAAKSLWNVTKNAELVVPVLGSLLGEKWPAGQDDDEARRRFLQTAIDALRRIGPSAITASSALSDKTKDKNRSVSESATRALKEIAESAGKKQPELRK